MADKPQDFKLKFKAGSDILQSIFESGRSPMSEQFLRWKLWAHWQEIVGSQMADVCEPVGYERGILKIWVKNSSWMQQLVFFKEEILKKIHLNPSYKSMRNIVFTLDRRSVPKESEEKSQLQSYLKK